jgi:hypothetical protein
MNYIKVLLLVIISICATSVLYAQVNGTGSIVVLVASTPIGTPTPTPTPTPPPGTTFSTAFACSTSARAQGGCNFNGVTYGAGGIPLPTLNASNTSTANCTGAHTGDSAILTAAAGSGGTSANHKGVLIKGSQCYMDARFEIPAFTDVQCSSPTTVITNPTSNTATASEYASFEVDGPPQGGSSHDVTVSNCTFNGTNTQPPGYGGCNGAGCSPPPGNSFAVLIEHASNVTVEDNLFTNTMGQAAIEPLGGSSGTPDSSNEFMIWNTFDSCALYGATSDNITNSQIRHNYMKDCRVGNELDASTYGGTYFNDYNYIYVHYGVGYYYVWCGGPGGLDAFCTLKGAGQSCEMTGNILDGGGNGRPSCPNLIGEFTNTSGIMTLEGEGGTWTNNYCPNNNTAECGCDSVGSGCTTNAAPNPAPFAP